MNAKASPWQNGYQELFYAGFKLKLGHPECYPTLGELVKVITQQIHDYNYQRIHTAWKYPPTVFAVHYKVSTATNHLLINREIVVRQFV